MDSKYPREFEVTQGEEGTRLESFLRVRLGLARPSALKALRKGWVRVDGKRAKGSRRLTLGETVRITNYGLPLPALEREAPPPPAVPGEWVDRARASLIHQDPALIVSSKPSGVVVHKGTNHAYGWIDALAAALGEAPPTPIGRLDRDTSGLLALARGRAAARALFDALRDGRLHRTYTVLVAGVVPDDDGVVEVALAKEGLDGEEQMRPSPEGQEARTRYHVVRRLARATLLSCELETGRTHQIRAHMLAIGHPVLGDARYGSTASHALTRALGLERLALHAGRLALPHPDTGDERVFEAPTPHELQAAVARAREPS